MRSRRRLQLSGMVQGLGVRPYIYRLAKACQLVGWVKNSPQGVIVEVEGDSEMVEKFCARLKTETPPLVEFHSYDQQQLETLSTENKFQIMESQQAGTTTSWLLPDLAICQECQTEVLNPNNRRYLFPFANCTYCGPRYSIIESLPYDRPNTSMAQFDLCDQCQSEYENPEDRRFHAQPMACPQCGPQLELWNKKGEVLAKGAKALEQAVAGLKKAQVVALKGLGGFHLLVDAKDSQAVDRLRERKGRGQKPFALMFSDLADLKKVAQVSEAEAQWLQGPYSPIVLVKKKSASEFVQVAPGQGYLGVMLPYTPLHLILMKEFSTPVVCTSGNLSEEPICIDEKEALSKLSQVADLFLVHNRPIVRPVEDSVLQVVAGHPMLLRRGRGFAPKTWSLASNQGSVEKKSGQKVFALGGDLKHALGLARPEGLILGTHVGDVVEADAYRQMISEVQAWKEFFQLENPQWIADPHPHYQTHQWLKNTQQNFASLQHHRAHAWGVWAEHGGPHSDLAVIWDGSGYGDDGSVWGGEFFAGSPDGSLPRWGSLWPMALYGGDKSIKNSSKSALALLDGLYDQELWTGSQSSRIKDLGFGTGEQKLLAQFPGSLRIPTSSMGRLFDGVSALLGLHQGVMSFEGEAAMKLQMAAESSDDRATYVWEWCRPQQLWLADWRPMLSQLLEDQQKGVEACHLARRYHNGLVDLLVSGWQRSGGEFARVLVSGGCFQNRLLLELLVQKFKNMGVPLVWPQLNPPNDGGLALGQLAWWKFQEESQTCV